MGESRKEDVREDSEEMNRGKSATFGKSIRLVISRKIGVPKDPLE